MSHRIRLGAFTLQQPLSQGGMGTVWRATHRSTGVDVAIKVIANSVAQNPIYLEGFEREVRAVARMQHPRVVRVFDYGRVDSAAEKSSEGELPRQSPWLAMELATHQSLVQMPAPTEWSTLSIILFDILDALAHAHARGIVHRDLKPGNVLLTRCEDGLHCKLTDFGISHIAENALTTREVFATAAGTPWYMAPEQVEGRWRDYGPWTDLYALGCVAYQLASGITPFTGDSVLRVARAQLFEEPPPLTPRFAVPNGFVEWVEGLMVKDVSHRCRRAADAAWALHQLSPRRDGAIPAKEATAASGEPTLQLPDMDSSFATLTFVTTDLNPPITEPLRGEDPVQRRTKFDRPPFSTDWADPTDTDESRLPGAGLGLYRLRETPFVGRERERNILWEQLRRALNAPSTRAVVIRGGPGTGKSRLAQWISRRAHELGLASLMGASHGPLGDHTAGLNAMFAEYLGTAGLDYERTFDRVLRLLAADAPDAPEVVRYYAAAIARFQHPDARSSSVPAVQFTNADERYATVRRLATALADRRALVMVLDDVQWSYDTLEFALRLRDQPHAILLVLTVRPDQLVGRPLESELLREFEASDGVVSLELDPLSRREYGRLIDRLLWLEPTLREQILERGSSSPLFASELIGDWVHRRVLQASNEGFRLDTMEEVPRDLQELWNRRVDSTLAQFSDPETARAAVEVGAALGSSVHEREWLRVCEKLRIDVADDLVDQLVVAGLLERTEDGWAFHHQMLRESIEQRAQEHGSAKAHHRALADILQFETAADVQFRRALHFLAVGDEEEAISPLILAAEAMIENGRVRAATAVVDTLQRVAAGLPEDHRVKPRVIEVRLSLLRHSADREILDAFLSVARPIALRNGWHSTLSDIFRTEATLATDMGQMDLALERLKAALRHGRQSRNPAKVAAAHRSLGFVAVRQGDYETAQQHFETARDHYHMANLPQRVSEAIVGLADCELRKGNFAGAYALSDEAIGICREGGYRTTLCQHLSQRGDIAAAEHNYTDARRYYAESAELARLVGDRHNYPISIMNLGVSLIHLGQNDAARDKLLEALEIVENDDLALFAMYSRIALHLWIPAAQGDHSEWDRHYIRFATETRDFAVTEAVEHTLAACRWWVGHGDAERAFQALALAKQFTPANLVDEMQSTFVEVIDEIEMIPSKRDGE